MKLFEGRTLAIATMHKKEDVIAPLLETALGVKCIAGNTINTDQFGTFSGEIERTQTPIEAAISKCMAAMQQYNCDLAVASEGSFGHHPSIFFIPADEEYLVLIDKINGLKIIARYISTNTNFMGKEIRNKDELIAFADKIGFPSHGIILKNKAIENKRIIKDFKDPESLIKAYHELNKNGAIVLAETDMRAMNNPTRMNVIAETTTKLIEKIQSTCPVCNFPGFSITDAVKGLPCSLCNAPTRSVKAYIYECEHCNYKKEDKYPNKITAENPRYCDYCNP